MATQTVIVTTNESTVTVSPDQFTVTVAAPQTVTVSNTGPQGPQGATGATGATGAQGPSGVIGVTSPITNSGTSTSAQIGINQSLLTLSQSQVTNLTTDLAAKATALDEVIPTDPTGAYFDGTGLRLYGTTGNYASAPDPGALSGALDLRAKISLTDWTPTTPQSILGQWAGSNRGYLFRVETDGKLQLIASADGSTSFTGGISTVATGIADGATKWVRVTYNPNTGTQREAFFYLSDDGVTWTQLGTSTNGPATTQFDSTRILEIGSNTSGTADILNGKVFRAQVLNGIGGTTVFDANFETVPADSFAFTESSSNAATVTLTTTRYSFGMPNAMFTTTSTTSLVTNNTYYSPFKVVGKSITIRHVAFEVTVAPTSNSTTRIGIYAADAQMQPTGNILYESGAVTVVSTAAALYRLRITPLTLQPGNYLLAFNQGANGYTMRFWQGTQMAFIPNTMGASLSRVLTVGETLGSNPLPTTGTKWTGRGLANGTPYCLAVLGWS